MRRKVKLRIGIFLLIIIVILGLTGFAILKNQNSSMDKEAEYINDDFGFMVKYPEELEVEMVPRIQIEGSEMTPDSGIIIYLNQDKSEKIYVYGQIGHVNIPKTGFEVEVFDTDLKESGMLLTQKVVDDYQMYVIYNDGFHAASIYVSGETYRKQLDEIKAILSSFELRQD